MILAVGSHDARRPERRKSCEKLVSGRLSELERGVRRRGGMRQEDAARDMGVVR